VSRVSNRRCCRSTPWLALLFVVLATTTAGVAKQRHGSRTLRVGTSGDYAPFSVTGAAGHLSGLDIDVAGRMGRDLGREVEFVRFAWPELLARLQDGAFDIVMSGVTMREDRAALGCYSRPYVTTGAVLLVRADDAARFDSAAALNRPHVRIVVNAGGHLERVARERFPLAAIDAVRDNASMPDRVLNGTADAALTDSAEARVWQRPRLRVIGPLTHDHKAFLLPAAGADLAARVDAWMVARENDGWLNERRRQWLGSEFSMDASLATRQAVAALIRVRLGLMPAVAAAKRAAGLPIEDPEQEARVLSRVAAAAAPDPERTLRVYRLIIEMAKAVQRTSEPPSPTVPLGALRDAVRRIDEQLVREIRRRPVATTGEWSDAIEPDLLSAGIDASAIRRLASVLAALAE